MTHGSEAKFITSVRIQRGRLSVGLARL